MPHLNDGVPAPAKSKYWAKASLNTVHTSKAERSDPPETLKIAIYEGKLLVFFLLLSFCYQLFLQVSGYFIIMGKLHSEHAPPTGYGAEVRSIF